MFITFYQIFSNAPQDGKSVAFSQFWEEVEKNNVKKVTIKGSEISGELIEGPHKLSPRGRFFLMT